MKAKKTKYLSIAITALLSGAALASAPPSSTTGSSSTMSGSSTMSSSSTMGNSSSTSVPAGRKAGVQGQENGQRGLGRTHASQGSTSEPNNAAPAMASFKALDKNGNGRLSRQEVSSNNELTRQFSKWDSNGDGEIEQNEYHDMQVRLGSVKHPGRATTTGGSSTTSGAGTMSSSSTTGSSSTMSSTSTTSNSSTMGSASTMSSSNAQSGASGGAAMPAGKATMYEGDLSGDNESPEVDTDAKGQFKAALRGNRLEVSGYFNNLSSQLKQVAGTSAHIHMRQKNGPKNGPVEFKLDVHPNRYHRSGTFNGDFTLNQQQMKALKDGDFYINVHTNNHPKGEVRAQLEKSGGGFFGM